MPKTQLSSATQPSPAIIPHLADLRRYAAALTGAVSSGDAYVVACLEAILESPELMDRRLPLRQALYRAFSKIWQGANTDRDYVTAMPDYEPLFALLQMLDPVSRQAVLLTTFSAFSYADAAAVLGHTPAEIRKMCLDASAFLQSRVTDDDDGAPGSDGVISEPFFPPAAGNLIILYGS
ncbi:MAG: hypothetical protein JNM81_02850 [Rhodospirillaceae bacterium]|nr:hypothetical protein [Rhodospirillaceae bacterium]